MYNELLGEEKEGKFERRLSLKEVDDKTVASQLNTLRTTLQMISPLIPMNKHLSLQNRKAKPRNDIHVCPGNERSGSFIVVTDIRPCIRS